MLGDATRQTNWAARNTSYVEQDFDARLKGFDDRAHTVEVLNRRAGTAHAVIRRDYSELLPLVRHKGRPSHPDVRRILERERIVRLTIDAGLQVRTARALRDQAGSARSGRGEAVVIGGGVHKATAILGAVRTGLIDVLITDDDTARAVLALHEPDSGPRHQSTPAQPSGTGLARRGTGLRRSRTTRTSLPASSRSR